MFLLFESLPNAVKDRLIHFETHSFANYKMLIVLTVHSQEYESKAHGILILRFV